MLVHERTHAGTDAYKCGLCPFSTRSASGIAEHVTAMHPEAGDSGGK